MELINISDGNNNYILPHVLKHKLEKGQLTLSMWCLDGLKKAMTEI